MNDVPNPITRRYLASGLPPTVSAEQAAAWASYLAGTGAPLRLLPTNGDVCTAATHSPAGCGYPLLIDGTCVNSREHLEVQGGEASGGLYAEFDSLLAQSSAGEGAGPHEEMSPDERVRLGRDVEEWERGRKGPS